MQIIQDFLTNLRPIISLLAALIGIYLLLLWAATVLWAHRDIRMRSEDVSVHVLTIGLMLFIPFASIPLYLIVRPRQTLSDKYERSLEEEYLRRDIEEKYVCPACQRPIEHDFIMCPHCHTSLRRHCSSCERVIDLTWSVCPYCAFDGQNGRVRVYQPQTNQPQASQPHIQETAVEPRARPERRIDPAS
jgi:RNA polymerase subunit RPABC4/transcription elongation factor Spt4